MLLLLYHFPTYDGVQVRMGAVWSLQDLPSSPERLSRKQNGGEDSSRVHSRTFSAPRKAPCQICLQNSQHVGQMGPGHGQSWCHVQTRGLGHSLSPSALHPSRLGTGRGPRGRLGCLFGLPFLQNSPLNPDCGAGQDQTGQQWEGKDLTGGNQGTSMQPGMSCTSEPQFPTFETGR